MALTSAALLIASFPNFNQPWCAWIALVPWLLTLQEVSDTSQSGRSVRHFWRSYLVGLVFFLGSLSWLLQLCVFGGPLAAVGWLALSAYLALYFGAFGWVASRTSSLIVLPAAWVALEYLRSHALSGFGWNLLGYSQTPYLPVIQAADLTGVWGISWLVVLVNVALASALRDKGRTRVIPLAAAAVVVAASVCYGRARLAHPDSAGTPMEVAVAQGNIPQEQKWDEAYRDAILERYERLTREAAAQHPDLIVWPEASVPGLLIDDEALTARIRRLTRDVGVPVLLGAPLSKLQQGVSRYTNSAAILGPDGSIAARYDKIHLVPFGEFVPLSGVWPWLRDVLPPIGDFVPGHEYTVFSMKGHGARGTGHGNIQEPPPLVSRPLPPFGVLICFEDVFPELARRFARQGARWLITITNDAWFGKTGAPYQHAQASTFRAVELRMPMVRAANTGWSGCIDACGRWTNSVHDAQHGELFVDGIATCRMSAPTASNTLYFRWGDWFAWLCIVVCLGWVGFAIIRR